MDFNECVAQGSSLFKEGKIDQAITKFEEALAIQENADIRQMVEMMKTQVNMVSHARQSAANEAKHRASLLQSLMGRTVTVANISEVIEELEKYLNRNPNDASAKHNLASAYYIRGVTFTSKGEHKQAAENYSKAIENNPDYPHALIQCGRAYLEMANASSMKYFLLAIDKFEKMLQLHPDDARAKNELAGVYTKRGMEYHKKGEYVSAVADFEMAFKIEPDDSTRELLEMAKAEK